MADIGTLEFHHIHFYVDEIKPLATYKALEDQFNKFASSYSAAASEPSSVEGRSTWESQTGNKVDPAAYVSQGQDLIRQAISGLGWRVTGYYEGSTTTSALVTSRDPHGVRFVLTSPAASNPAKKAKASQFDHFDVANWKRFKDCHAQRQGVAVLAFRTGKDVVDRIHQAYKNKHAALIKSFNCYTEGSETFKVLEVSAYYLPNSKDADKGTMLRFVEHSEGFKTTLPGLEPVEAKFAESWDTPAYSDHWVSNVVDRVGFMKTLEETLGFVPKVDFNAGVVAAGEAIIESTVVGNTPSSKLTDEAEALKAQNQIFLPTNNALSEVGHVHLFIEEIGQGIQHLASRVKDLAAFIARVNKIREMTGEGFKFLNIPPSYYGRLAAQDLEKMAGMSGASATDAISNLAAAGLISKAGVVSMDIDDDKIKKALGSSATDDVITVVKRGRYSNMYKLLKDNLSEASYLRIVRNKILVDIQGDDMLYQIFTANILQNQMGEESPFLEFIQRVCSEKKDSCGKPAPIRPGCGGFGIRNFLTLFLSIEVSKAMLQYEKATEAKDEEAAKLADKMVATFTDQLDESNPILTLISDAMTAEADAMAALKDAKDETEKAKLTAEIEKQRSSKEKGNEMLQACSTKYKEMMKELRASAK
mmetsp:Transcript_46962/g.92451  ORF Transcript_46962/g.92451 Transcript_46962/m.92451 type:complete len:646 (+) Transcript_46962:52-1989(+)|eukprot:CAMPEP_0175148786 /NCGR_PEP_ID=MMETSP0087-20121206/16838_1 /TAXON_ID=136419 /ORGANISM="Unknown Unknown, Strain D1" /LENGTH=645 /DNA_ID=CAMNT_0016434319 /DNA_START=34 /DNA_END=1971 /DNA_ORIENTATION=+